MAGVEKSVPGEAGGTMGPLSVVATGGITPGVRPESPSDPT